MTGKLWWETTAVTGNLANNPFNLFTARRRARLNVEDLLVDRPGLIATQEAWHPLTRWGIYAALAAAGGYRHYSAGPLQSCVLAWDARRYDLIREGWFLLHGTVRAGSRIVSDARKVPWVLLRDKKTGHCFIFADIHPTPPGTLEGDAAIRAAALARSQGYTAFVAWAKERHYPIICSGDWNDPKPEAQLRARGLQLAQGASAPDGEPIDRHVVIGRPRIRLELGDVTLVHMRRTDHKGGARATIRAWAA